jgi:uncharacterized protein YjlB
MTCIHPSCEILARYFERTGFVPNSSLPALVYKNLIKPGVRYFDLLKPLIEAHRWYFEWLDRDAMASYVHYHSTAHELLVVLEGFAILQLGGNYGQEIKVQAGDSLFIPAGVAHRRIRGDKRFTVAGFYPAGQKWDMRRAKEVHLSSSIKKIKSLPLPYSDPFYGTEGPLLSKYWK